MENTAIVILRFFLLFAAFHGTLFIIQRTGSGNRLQHNGTSLLFFQRPVFQGLLKNETIISFFFIVLALLSFLFIPFNALNIFNELQSSSQTSTWISLFFILASLVSVTLVKILTETRFSYDLNFSLGRLTIPLILIFIINRVSALFFLSSIHTLNVETHFPHLPVNLLFNPISFFTDYIAVFLVFRFFRLPHQVTPATGTPVLFRLATTILSMSVFSFFIFTHLGSTTLPLSGPDIRPDSLPVQLTILTAKMLLLTLITHGIDRILPRVDPKNIESFLWVTIIPLALVNILFMLGIKLLV